MCLNWTRKFGNRHVKKNFVDWCFFSKFLLLLIVTELEDIRHGNSRLLHVRNCNSPVVICTSESDSSIHDAYLPGFLEFFRSKLLDESVDLGDCLFKSLEHVFRCNLQFIDESIDFVDEENRLYFLLQCLANNSFSLGHWAFNSTSQNETSVNSTHGTSYVSTEVNVTWCVDEVDEEICSINSVYH